MTVVDKMTPDEYAIYSAINHADDDWTMEATEVLNRIKAKVWEEGFSAAIAGWNARQLNVRNPYAD